MKVRIRKKRHDHRNRSGMSLLKIEKRARNPRNADDLYKLVIKETDAPLDLPEGA